MAILYSNNAYATLAAGINSSATALTVASGLGARFPAISGSDFFYVTLVDSVGNLEIVKVTARSTDVFTIVRAQDSTAAQAFSLGDGVQLRIIKAMLDVFPQTGGPLGSPSTVGTMPAFTLGGTVAGGGNQINNVIIGTTTPLAGSFTTLTTSSTVTHNGGTANGVAYLNGSKVLTTGTALTFDGTTATTPRLAFGGTTLPSAGTATIFGRSSDNNLYLQSGSGNDINFIDGSQNTMLTLAPATLTFQISNVNKLTLNSTGLQVVNTLSGGTSGTAYSFSGSAPAGSLTLDSSGNLSVLSTGVPAQFSSSNASNTLVQQTNTSASRDLIYRFRQNAGAGNWYDLTMEGSTNAFTIDYNDNERLRIDSSGLAVTGTLSATANIAGVAGNSVSNTNTAAGSWASWAISNGTRALKLATLSTGWNGTFLTGGPTTEQSVIYTDGNIPIVVGINNLPVGQFSSTGLAVYGTGSFTGDLSVGNAVAATNVGINLLGVASKAKRIVFKTSGAESWLIGMGAASETDAFEIYNGNGNMTVSINKSTSVSSFGAGIQITPNGVAYASTSAFMVQGYTYASDFSIANATAQIIGTRMTNDTWNPTLNIVTARQSLTTGSLSFGGIGFSTIDASNSGGMRDGARIAIVNETTNAVASPTAMAFYTNTGSATQTFPATEQMRLNSTGAVVLKGGSVTANGVGITFPATQSASSDANTLDDYEEGTWNASGITTVNCTGASFSEGRYTKIGNIVHIQGKFSLTVTTANTLTYVVMTAPLTPLFSTSGSLMDNSSLVSGTLQITDAGNAYAFFAASASLPAGATLFYVNAQYQV